MYYAYLVLQQQNSIANNLFYSKITKVWSVVYFKDLSFLLF